jgi:hypothetical protein
MKNKILFIALLFASLGFNSCSNFLEEDPKSQMSESEAYKSSDMIYLNTVASIYPEIGGTSGGNGLGGTDRGIYDLNTFTSDEAILPTRGGDWYDGGLWQAVFTHKWGVSNSLVLNSWNYLYRVIGICNQKLDKINSLLEADPSNKYLPGYKAEVRAVRALFYYYLLDMYARVPIVQSSTTTIADVQQSKRSEVFAFVKKELQDSYPYLNAANSTKSGAYYGRVTRPVAFFLLAKLALETQVYSDDDWTDNSGVPNGSTTFAPYGNCWKACAAYCDSITKSGYSLEGEFSANFAVKNENSKENIFVIPMDPTVYPNVGNYYIVRSLHYTHMSAFGLSGWNGASATKELLAVFRKGGDDPRLTKSFYTGKVTGPDGGYIKSGTVDLEYIPDAIALDLSGAAAEKTAGARWAKYAIDVNAGSGGQVPHNDYVLFRYADALLMKSEALVRDGQNGDAQLKLVRDRVSAPNRTATLDNLLDERMLELSWEGVRRQDLIRFGKFHLPITDRPTSAPYLTVFPIPQDVLSLNKNLTQNRGY